MRRRATPLSTALLALVALGLLVGATVPAAAHPSGMADSPTAAVAAQSAGGCQFPVERTDATGTNVTVDSAPDSVVALQPSAAQTMWEIGARDAVVGMPVNEYTSDLEGYREPENVVGADGFTVEVETVVDLEPDLVLAPNVTPADTVASLRRAGLTVYHFREAGTLEDVYAKTSLTGRLTGHCDGAEERVAWMRDHVDRVRGAVGDEPRPKVLYPLGGGVVAGSDTFVHEVVTAAGGRNVAAEAGISGYDQLSGEVIVERDPEWLVLNDGLPRSAIRTDAYNRTTAVREDQTIRVNPDYANQPAPRVVYAIERIARALHPGAMAEANETATAGTATASGTEPSPEPTTTEGTPSPGQPGFGLGAGIVAFVLAVLAARRT